MGWVGACPGILEYLSPPHLTDRAPAGSDPSPPSSLWEALSWAGTHPLEQEAHSLDFSKGRGPDEGGEAMLVRLVDEVVAWQEGGGTTGMHPCPLSLVWREQGQGGWLGSDGSGSYTCGHSGPFSTHMPTPAHVVKTGIDTPAGSCGHTPFLRCSFSWLSSPWAASWWMDRARGQREAESSPVLSPLRASVYPTRSCSPQPPLFLLLREAEGLQAHLQSRVAGRAETSFPRCRLVRVVECFRELPPGTERKGLSFQLPKTVPHTIVHSVCPPGYPDEPFSSPPGDVLGR